MPFLVQPNDSPASSFSIDERNGDYDITLWDRALPYRPVTFGGKQRVEFSWYPGVPIATAQVLGPEEESITLKGFWKDRFIAENPGSSHTMASSFAADSPDGAVRSVAELVRIVDTMRRRGLLCRLTWDSLVRDGHITKFVQTWHNRHDVEWELEFTPISQGESLKPLAVPPMPELPDLSANWELFHSQWNNRMQALPALGLADTIAAFLDELDDSINAITAGITDTVYAVTSDALAGPDALNRVIALGNGVVLQAAATFVTVCDAADEAIFPILGGTAAGINTVAGTDIPTELPDDLSLTETIQANVYKTTIKTSIRDVRNNTIDATEQYTDTLNPQLLQTFIAKGDTDLRDVSTQFYGNPNEWRNLMLFNRLTTSKLSAGDLVFVPQQGNASTATNTPGATQ